MQYLIEWVRNTFALIVLPQISDLCLFSLLQDITAFENAIEMEQLEKFLKL